MDRSHVVRRAVHMSVALAPLYYLLPVEFEGVPVRRWQLLMVFFFVVAVFEAIRLRRGMTFTGLRPHEMHSIASFAWAAAGVTAALWLMPMEIATPVLIGMGLCDPLAGELRRKKTPMLCQIALPVVAYFMICVGALALMTESALVLIVTISVAGSFLAMATERYRIRFVDDDFLMIVMPGALMSALWLGL
ncbi:MAG: hypothetical protein JSV90_02045 [Methanobacteriota archaeon]|nr:MAG: hypothetical protein JSV90_02045 [Euryarchaeota archaeon]